MNSFKITFDIDTTDPTAELHIGVFLNEAQVFSKNIIGPEMFSALVPDSEDETEKELRIILSGKTLEHTKIDAESNIIADALVTIKNFQIDGIAADQILSDVAVYTHDFNGTSGPCKDKFYGSIGCNGTVSFKFTTPIYIWILEHI
jgi:hypothetical protein